VVCRRQAWYRFENQSVDKLMNIMRERHFPYLIVIDDNMRMVVTLEDLMRKKRQNPPSQDPSEGGV
jgi:hypothetical protein